MISVFLTRKPRLSKVMEELQLVGGGMGFKADRLTPVGSNASPLHKEAHWHIWCSMLPAHVALCLLPSRVPGASWIRSFSLHHPQFFVQEVIGTEGLMAFQGQLQFVCTRLSSVPVDAGTQTQPPAVPPGLNSPVVPACLCAGSWEAGSSLTLGFSSPELTCPQVNSKGRSHTRALPLNGAGRMERATALSLFTCACCASIVRRGQGGGFVLLPCGPEVLVDTKASAGY